MATERKYRTKSHAIVKKMMESGRGAPHLVEVAEQLIAKMGGTEAFVDEIVTQYKEAPKNQKPGWCKSFLKLIEATTEMGGGGVKDLGMFTEQDLTRLLTTELAGFPLVEVQTGPSPGASTVQPGK